MNFLKWFALVLLVPCSILQAKQSPPLDALIELERIEVLGSSVEYHLLYKCQPWVHTDRLIFNLKLPEGFTLEEGFNYWEGEIKEKSVFSRNFIIKGPVDKRDKVVINAKIIIEETESYKGAEIFLGKNESLKKANVDSGSDNGFGQRRGRIRNGAISRE